MVEAYNMRIHSATGMKPSNVTRRNQRRVWQKLYGNYLRAGGRRRVPVFRVGDRVRLSKTKKLFRKGYAQGWTEEIYRVSDVLNTIPLTYAVVDNQGESVSGGFYAQELTKVMQ